MEIFLEVLNSCLTKQQVEVLRVALKQDAEVYFYGTGLGKSLLTEVLVNAGYKVDEPGNQPGRRAHPMCVPDRTGTVAFCLRTTPEKTFRRKNYYDVLLGCKEDIITWVNQ